MRSHLVHGVVLLFLLVAVPAQDVLVGHSADRRTQAFLSPTRGLYLRGWPAAPGGVLHIGHGSEPRFDAGGRLHFTRVTDDGYRVTSSSTWVVEAGSLQPRLLPPGASSPAYTLPAPPALAAGVPIAVDAGHGGSDPGAVGNGVQEKDINLDIALRLAALLDLDTRDTRGGGEWSVLMTRGADVAVSLSQRSNAANAFGARSFLSIHNNAAGSASATGSETYCYIGQESSPGGQYRNRLHRELLAAWQLRDRGVKTANFHVLRETRMPAALIEGGFVTNAGDAAKMKDPTARQRLALGLLWATQEHHGFTRYTPQSGPLTGVLRGVVYDSSRGTGVRISGALVSLADGTFQSSTGSGAFSFTLPVGTYRYAATAPGYEPAELGRTVVAGQEVWGSIGLLPANVPALRGPTAVAAGSAFTMTLAGDPGSAAFLLLHVQPFLPLLPFSTMGSLWPDTRGGVVLRLPPVPAAGVVSVRFNTPSTPGLRAHLQGLVSSRGTLRLSNGAAVQLQ